MKMTTPVRRTIFAKAPWIGLLPFFVFALVFELLPMLNLVRSAFTVDGALSLGNFGHALTPTMIAAFGNSLQLSFTTAFFGMIFGTVVAYAIVTSENAIVRNALTALADVTANFGGAPLAFAFIITLGSTGFVTMLLQSIGIELYPEFRIYSVAGLAIAYLYFQLPLFILLIIPALLGLKHEWREAATSLGATAPQYWFRIALPISLHLYSEASSCFLPMRSALMRRPGP